MTLEMGNVILRENIKREETLVFSLMERADLIINGEIRNFLSKMNLEMENEKERGELRDIIENGERISYSYLKELCLRENDGIELLDKFIRSTRICFDADQRNDSNESNDQSEEEERGRGNNKRNSERREYRKLVGISHGNSFVSKEREEWRKTSRELSFILNGVFSVVGSGIAIFIITGYIDNLILEWRILLSFLAAFIVIIAEVFLVIRFNQIIPSSSTLMSVDSSDHQDSQELKGKKYD